jgi:predicted enzyme related to lactoylglutathione lyase
LDDARSVAERAEALGGRVLMSPTPVPNAGELTFLAEPSGNAIGAMPYR